MSAVKHACEKLIIFNILLSLPISIKASNSNNNNQAYNTGISLHQKDGEFMDNTYKQHDYILSNKKKKWSRNGKIKKDYGSFVDHNYNKLSDNYNNQNNANNNKTSIDNISNSIDISQSQNKKDNIKYDRVRSSESNTNQNDKLLMRKLIQSNTHNLANITHTTTYNIYLRAVPLMIEVFELTMLLALVVVIFKYRSHKPLKTNTWPLLLTVVVGCVLLHIAVVLRYFEANFTLCILMSWFRELGFAVVYGSLLLKIYKVSSELRSRRTHRYQASDRDLIRCLSLIVIVVVVFMLSFNALVVDSNCDHSLFWRSLDVTTENESYVGNAFRYGDGVYDTRRRELMEGSDNLNYLLGNYDANGKNDAEETLSVHEHDNNNKNNNYYYSYYSFSNEKNKNNKITPCSLLIRNKVYEHEFLLCRFGWWDVLVQLIESTFLCYLIKSALKCKACNSGVWLIIIVTSVELVISFVFFVLRWVLWTYSHSDTIFLLYFFRAQLTTAPVVLLVVLSKLWMAVKSTHTNAQEDDGMVKLKAPPRCDVKDFKIENMTADDIRAELKRLYTQLHLHRKTEMINKNPHLSSKKGGRKSVYRRLSLQAFQLRHKRQMTNFDTTNEVSRSPQESVTSVDKE